MMLAKQSPWSIVYPTLVDVNAYEEGTSEELLHLLACLVREMYFNYFDAVVLLINRFADIICLFSSFGVGLNHYIFIYNSKDFECVNCFNFKFQPF